MKLKALSSNIIILTCRQQDSCKREQFSVACLTIWRKQLLWFSNPEVRYLNPKVGTRIIKLHDFQTCWVPTDFNESSRCSDPLERKIVWIPGYEWRCLTFRWKLPQDLKKQQEFFLLNVVHLWLGSLALRDYWSAQHTEKKVLLLTIWQCLR